MSSMKRVHDEAGHDHDRSKRSRRSRWGHDDEEEGDTSAPQHKTSASPKSLSDIVKRLSSVVKEKTAPEELAAAATRPLIVSNLCINYVYVLYYTVLYAWRIDRSAGRGNCCGVLLVPAVRCLMLLSPVL